MGRISVSDTHLDFVRRHPTTVETFQEVSPTKRYYTLTAPCGCTRTDPYVHAPHPISGWSGWQFCGDGQTYLCDACAGEDD